MGSPEHLHGQHPAQGLQSQGAAQPVVAVIYTDAFPWDSHSQPSDSKNPGATVLALQDLESYSSTLTRE